MQLRNVDFRDWPQYLHVVANGRASLLVREASYNRSSEPIASGKH